MVRENSPVLGIRLALGGGQLPAALHSLSAHKSLPAALHSLSTHKSLPRATWEPEPVAAEELRAASAAVAGPGPGVAQGVGAAGVQARAARPHASAAAGSLPQAGGAGVTLRRRGLTRTFRARAAAAPEPQLLHGLSRWSPPVCAWALTVESQPPVTSRRPPADQSRLACLAVAFMSEGAVVSRACCSRNRPRKCRPRGRTTPPARLSADWRRPDLVCMRCIGCTTADISQHKGRIASERRYGHGREHTSTSHTRTLARIEI